MDQKDIERIYDRCDRYLTHHHHRSPKQTLLDVAAAINDDARAYLARTDEQYDLIVFGLLDSHTLLSSMSSLRLDSYVYTLESLEQARAHLAPGGHLALAFAASVGGWDWLAARLYQMVASTFGEEPVALTLGYDVSTLFMVGLGVRERAADDPALAALRVDPAPLRAPILPATDDWPFLYLVERGIPGIYQWSMLGMGVFAALLVGLLHLSTRRLERFGLHDRGRLPRRSAAAREDLIERGIERFVHDDPVLIRHDDALQFGNEPAGGAQIQGPDVYQRFLDGDHQQRPLNHFRPLLVP